MLLSNVAVAEEERQMVELFDKGPQGLTLNEMDDTDNKEVKTCFELLAQATQRPILNEMDDTQQGKYSKNIRKIKFKILSVIIQCCSCRGRETNGGIV